MSAGDYFELFAELLKNNPPHEMDWNIVKQLKQIGITPGQNLKFSKLPKKTQKALKKASKDALKLIANHGKSSGGEVTNGWMISRSGMGTYGAAYLDRAYVALIGLGANLPEASPGLQHLWAF